MIVTIPAVWFAGIPTAPVGMASMPAAMLVLLGLLGAAVLLLFLSGSRIVRRLPMSGGRFAHHLRMVPPHPARARRRSPAGLGTDIAATGADRLAGYLRFLATRDGAPDLGRHSLAARDVFFAQLDANPLRSRAAIDRDAFRRNLRRRRPEPGLDQRMLWLLASAKANQAERFGVGFSELYGRVPEEDDDPLRLHIHLQETYHTRILADAVALFGVSVHNGPPPPWTRALIKLMVFAPPRWVLPLIGCSEMAGCVIFRALRDRGLALLADEPAIAERVRLLYDEILADEISHVGCIAAQLGPRGCTLMRFLYRHLSTSMCKQMPELAALFGAAELAHRFRTFRHEALLAEYSDTAYAAALV